MMNIMRADIYRIVRGKGVYVTLAILLAVIILQVSLGTKVNAGVDVKSFEMLKEMEQENIELSDLIRPPYGYEAPHFAMAGSANILYLILPFLIFVGCTDFNTGAAKNALAAGLSRFKLYAAKLLLACICSVLLLLLYVLLTLILATVLNGFGGSFNAAFVRQVLEVLLPQILLLLAGTCVGHMFVFAFRRTAAFIGIYLAFLLLPSIVLVALSFASDWATNLYDFDITISLGLLSDITSLSGSDILRMMLIGCVYIIVSICGGFLLFRKAEIK